MIGPFPAYDGDEPYIFVSYAHEDAEVVFPHLVWLREHGVNVWYDDGISPGKNWRNEVARAMAGAHLFLFFVSPKSIESTNCLNEVDFALDSSRPLLSAYVAETKLTAALRFRIGNMQAARLFGAAEQDGRRHMSAVIRATLSRSRAEPDSASLRSVAEYPSNAHAALRHEAVSPRMLARKFVSSIAQFSRRSAASAAEKVSISNAAIAGVAVGAFCAALLFIPSVYALEQQNGLRWLFDLRGPASPPDSVAIVVMNQQAASNISLPSDPEQFHRCVDPKVGPVPANYIALPSMPSRWPRCLHAQLVQRLVEAGAQTIAFDVVFRERPPLPGASGDLNGWQDRVFASALAKADRVVVAQKLEFVDGHETLSTLSPAIEAAALRMAPFPLIIESGRVSRFPILVESELATPTLPAIVLEAYAVDEYPRLAASLAREHNDFAMSSSQAGDVRSDRLPSTELLIRQLFRDDPELSRRVVDDLESRTTTNDSARRKIHALISMYGGDDTRLVNFYGPSGTIPAIPYDRVLALASKDLASEVKGRAVFVGYSEADQPEQMEHFATAFSSERGADLSGVEIAATAFANLLEDSTIRATPFPLWLLLTFIFGLLSTFACLRLDNMAALVRIAVALIAYGGIVLFAFTARGVWIPFLIPTLVAVPVAVLSSFGWKYWTTQRQREHLRRAFSYFVPPDVVRRLERNAAEVDSVKESLECACVATDAANFTPLVEAMSAEQLVDFLNLYFEALFGGVAAHGGFVSDVAGDAMLAIWPHRSPDTHTQLLTGLLEMHDAAQQFNERLAGNQLLTRFGVDWGRVTLTTVGARPHYEYRAVGEAANLARRIQRLNERLDTRILLSHASLGDAARDFVTRDAGHFILRGQQQPVRIVELMATRAKATQQQFDLCGQFSECMEILRKPDVSGALTKLERVYESFPTDGPTSFYIRTLQSVGTLDLGALKVD